MTIQRFGPKGDPDSVQRALEEEGVVILEDLLSRDVLARMNEEVAGAMAAASPDTPLFNPVMEQFYGPCTRQVTGAAAISSTFATEVMCHPLLLALCDRLLLPSCARYQLNLGHLIQRDPGAENQWLHRDEVVWSDVPRPRAEVQLASVVAFVDFTRDNGATRIIPGSHRWGDRELSPVEQMAKPPPDDLIEYAEMPAGSAVVYSGGTIHGAGGNVTTGSRLGAHLSYCLGWLRTEENNYLAVPPNVAATLPRTAQELLGYAMHSNIGRGGGYLGMLNMQDPVELLARGELR